MSEASKAPDATDASGARRGEAITIGNEFAEVRISRVDT
jgi:hypothetical protein